MGLWKDDDTYLVSLGGSKDLPCTYTNTVWRVKKRRKWNQIYTIRNCLEKKRKRGGGRALTLLCGTLITLVTIHRMIDLQRDFSAHLVKELIYVDGRIDSEA